MDISSSQTIPDQKVDFPQKILQLMAKGEYRTAAQFVLQHAEDLVHQAESLSGEEKNALLEKSDCIASTYRELLFLASNKQLDELHRLQRNQISEMKHKTEELDKLSPLIIGKVAAFIKIYESLVKLFVIFPTRDNILNPALKRLKSFPGNELYAKEQILEDLFKLLGYVEPASSKLSFFRDRQQVVGTRYKCEQGYANALSLVDEVKGLLLQAEQININSCISYQEIYWHCGIDITSTVYGILRKVNN